MKSPWCLVPVLFQLSTGLLAAEAGGARQAVRIISTAPSVTEILYALGAADRLVGVTSFCDYPPEASKKTVIGDFAAPNLEVILRLRPDLLILLDDRQDLIEKFRAFGLPLLILRSVTIEDILTSIERIGARIGLEGRSTDLVRSIRNRLDTVQRRADRDAHPRTLFLVGRNPGALTDLYAVGRGSFIGELIEIAGGKNVLGEQAAPYPKVSIEDVLAADPEVIIDLSLAAGTDPAEVIRTRGLWRDFPTLTAVREGRVHLVQNQAFLIPGPRIAEAAEELAEILAGHGN